MVNTSHRSSSQTSSPLTDSPSTTSTSILASSRMHFTTLIGLTLVPAGAFAAPTPWAQSAAGEWIANNTIYPKVGSGKSTSSVSSRLDQVSLTHL